MNDMNRTVVKFVGKNMLKSLLYAGTVATVFAVPVQGSTISGQFSGTISAPAGQTSRTHVHSGAGTNELTWGAPTGPATEVEVGNASSLSVDPSSFNYTAGPGEFILGTISWINHSNWHAGGTWDSEIMLNLAFNTAGGLVEKYASFDFSVYNSLDVSRDTNENERLGSQPDEIRGLLLGDGAFDLPIDLGNGLKLTEVLFRLDEAGSAGAAWTEQTGYLHDGRPSGSRYNVLTGLWENREGGVSQIGVYGTVSAVPLPAGLWLMLSGFMGFLVLKRRNLKPA